MRFTQDQLLSFVDKTETYKGVVTKESSEYDDGMDANDHLTHYILTTTQVVAGRGQFKINPKLQISPPRVFAKMRDDKVFDGYNVDIVYEPEDKNVRKKKTRTRKKKVEVKPKTVSRNNEPSNI